MSTRAISLLGFSLGILTIVGCSRGPATPDLTLVEGKITLNGKAIEAGDIEFHPEDTKKSGYTGIVSSGRYSISAETGKYKVTIAPVAEEGKGASIPDKYQDVDQTPLTVQVTSGAAEGSYDLKLTN